MQTGQGKFGMQTMNQSLFELYTKRLISYEDAIGRSSQADELVAMIGRAGGAPSKPPVKPGRVGP
jgi:twitching motility protein PilT